jgi:hypothetical protein
MGNVEAGDLQFPAADVHHVNGGSVHVAYVEP